MSAYMGLFFALGLVALIESTHVYTKHHKDWCGYRVWPALFTQIAIPMIAVTLVYLAVLDFGTETPILKNYIIIVMAAGGLLAHYLPHHVLGKHWEPIVERPFTLKRLELTNSLLALPECRTILSLSIVDADLSERDYQALKAEASKDPLTGQEVLHIIKCVGTSRVCDAYHVYTRRHK
jgi:hypothetical protein